MDLDLKRVLQARPDTSRRTELEALLTPWGEDLDVQNVLSEHPRPQFQRDSWRSLNGWWDYAIRESVDAKSLWRQAPPPKSWDGKILVPFSPEAVLSHVGRQLYPTQLLWYRRELMLEFPKNGRHLLLHFEAVDYACALYVNGVQVGTHVGAYLPFDVDVTDAVREGSNVIELCVWDPSEYGVQLRGKQRINRANMWYAAQSGIWQTVWLEEVEAAHIDSINLACDADAGIVSVEASLSVAGGVFQAELMDAKGVRADAAQVLVSDLVAQVSVRVDNPVLWEVGQPYLYGLRLSYVGKDGRRDEVRSYVAFRTVGVELDEEGVAHFCLNHRPLFVRGVLDQGYWPDGLMTAPSDDALVFDIEAMRSAGFNMMRKHIKIESRRWYWHCDRLGMLVWQDMVSGGDIPKEWTSANTPTLFRFTWTRRRDDGPRAWKRFGADDVAYRSEWQHTAEECIGMLRNHPCIVTWVLFNESWGQFSSRAVCRHLRKLDPTRSFIATSGWYDQGAGDYYAVHNYFRGMRVYRNPHAGLLWNRRIRAFFINEFGGLTCPIEGHMAVRDATYGYDAFGDTASWRSALFALLRQVDGLAQEGLAGYVYTQLCDVEEETNGLLTYDRRVNKLTC